MIPVFLLAACRPEVSGGENDGKKTIRFGYQKFGIMTILKAEGTLDERLKKLGYDVVWTEFPGGPQMLEALNAGSIDFGATGEAPPIFAQAAGAPIVYFANEPEHPRGEAIVVPKNSPIQTVSDLKGKRIALNKGSNVHYLLVRALEEAGLDYDDVETVFLPLPMPGSLLKRFGGCLGDLGSVFGRRRVSCRSPANRRRNESRG